MLVKLLTHASFTSVYYYGLSFLINFNELLKFIFTYYVRISDVLYYVIIAYVSLFLRFKHLSVIGSYYIYNGDIYSLKQL